MLMDYTISRKGRYTARIEHLKKRQCQQNEIKKANSRTQNPGVSKHGTEAEAQSEKVISGTNP